MDDKQLEERLHLLKDSYERIPAQMDVDGILNKIEDAPQVIEKKNKGSKWQRVTVWMVSIASIFIIGVLGVSYTKEDVSQGNKMEELEVVTQQFLNRLNEEYPIEREKRRELLNLTEEEFSQIAFIQLADSEYDFYMNPNNYKNLYQTARDPVKLQSRLDDLIQNLFLPSQMLEEMEKKQTTLSEGETAEFFNSYSRKIKDLQDFYNKSKFLEEHIQMLEKESLYIEKNQFRYKFNENMEHDLRQYLDPSVLGYFTMLEKEPFTYAGELVYSLADSVVFMIVMENTIFDSSNSYTDKDKMKAYYTEIFHAVVKGTKDQSIYGEDGKVKTEYRKLWKEMLTETSNSPVNYILAPIVKEFEASGWGDSDSWEVLDYNDIDDVLHLAINGDLGQFIENPSNETFVDNSFVERVHVLYKSFVVAHDQTVLKDAKPEEIVGLYYYCEQLGDEKTKYELYVKDDQYQQISKEEYMNAPHHKLTDFRKEFSSLRFEQRSDEEGYVVLTLHPERTLYLHDKVIGFAVIHTENGWRAAFMPTQ